jgi:histidyl-tRNA synthetase
MSTDQPKGLLSTESYKGVRDFYPEDYYIHRWILETMRKACQSFGYTEYDASVLEPTELYTSKTSEEIINNQTYTFTDRGDRSVTLRPEMTPTVARMVAARWRDYPMPIRWFSIPNVFRYEKPQRGRLREHWQLNADMFGATGIEADVEMIALAAHVIKTFGATDSDFEIQINDRRLINATLEKIGATGEQHNALLFALDRKEKETSKDPAIASLMETYGTTIAPDEYLTQVMDALKRRGITNVRFSPYLVRGFAYYTGVVFEVFDTNPENRRSLFGGGRYDNLASAYTTQQIPAIGFGMGDVTIHDFLEIRNKLPAFKHPATVFIATTSPTVAAEAYNLATQFRDAGVYTSLNVTDKKIGDQIKYADKLGIPYVVVVGDDEVKNNTFVAKHLPTGNETPINRDDLTQFLQTP